MCKREKDADIARIIRMEQRFDALRAALESGAPEDEAEKWAQELEAYYTGGQWLADYERDERGGWPADLMRGVLSQDALYDLLEALDNREKD